MKSIVAVASGKGGVGKSTVAANLAVALTHTGLFPPHRVALIDVDFYGPSIPTLMGGGELKLDADEKFIPALRYGVKYISIAFFLRNPDDAVVWRGPMFSKAINQLFVDVNWGDVDIAIVDLPPGTGDAQLSLAQQVSLSGAIVVTTPQEVALADVRRAVNMFAKVNVPVLGVVENMAGFVAPTGEKYDIFGAGGGEELARQYGLDFFTSIPIDIELRIGGDKGEPIAMRRESPTAKIFDELAQKVVDKLAENERGAGALRVVN